MEDEGVKSALELAMERISGLPELTPEEIIEQKEKEFRPLGEALANKYMRGIVDAHDIPAELSRHQGDSGRIVRHVFISCVSRSVQLEDFQAAVKALDGLYRLTGDDMREKANAAWIEILEDFQQKRNQTLQECERAEMEKLSILGISGSAVRPSLSENESLNKKLSELHRSFEPDLEKLRAMFLQELQLQ